ncbi:POK9 protein, partial [Drymodes brunneopygia]|nr:POK9 protein [Drymodes brunneopygia]
RGRAGLDLALAESVTLEDDSVHVVPSTCSGPLGEGLSALLLGRSSASKQGLFVLPGVIDADYTGIIKIMLKAFCPPVTIPAGSKIAQLVPFKAAVLSSGINERGNGGFGSTGEPLVVFAEVVSKARPIRVVDIVGPDGHKIAQTPMMMDTGSDVIIIP